MPQVQWLFIHPQEVAGRDKRVYHDTSRYVKIVTSTLSNSCDNLSYATEYNDNDFVRMCRTLLIKLLCGDWDF